jgi:phosphatidylserine decarboxylase
VLVSPADGTIVEFREIEHDPYINGPAVQIGIFLSVFNVHINRVPGSCRVVGVEYRPGKFLNALLAASAIENERVTVRLEETATPFRGLIVRQIAGAIASRIVCWVQPGDALDIGAQFGMIKFGSRTELVFPREAGLELLAKPGQRVVAGETILVRYRS